jgi:UDP-2-acetamido-3-amino-2,3-dideoxy-glucuronate N-acetyltransferase
VNRHSLYEQTILKRGCTIGANATIVCGITIGRYAFVAAGAVVAKDVLDYALIVGVPGHQAGWMSRHGHRIQFNENGLAYCPESGFRYILEKGSVHCLDLDEEASIPVGLAQSRKAYDEFKINTHSINSGTKGQV